jgi:hypothetical protein
MRHTHTERERERNTNVPASGILPLLVKLDFGLASAILYPNIPEPPSPHPPAVQVLSESQRFWI